MILNLETDSKKNETGFFKLCDNITYDYADKYTYYICLIIRLWEFQNGKMGLSSLKIDRDTAKNVKIQILKNDSFC